MCDQLNKHLVHKKFAIAVLALSTNVVRLNICRTEKNWLALMALRFRTNTGSHSHQDADAGP